MLCYNAIKTWRASCELHTEKSSTRLVTPVLHWDNYITQLHHPSRLLNFVQSYSTRNEKDKIAFRKKCILDHIFLAERFQIPKNTFVQNFLNHLSYRHKIAHVISAYCKTDATFTFQKHLMFSTGIYESTSGHHTHACLKIWDGLIVHRLAALLFY